MDTAKRRTLWELYNRELTYLRESGRDFAARYPEMAWSVGRQAADPSVERLIQGVAYLNASVRARFDEEQVEVAQDLLRVLFPQCVRPTPAMVIQQFVPLANESQTRVIPLGAEVGSAPIALGEGANEVCRFRTTAAVNLPPVRVLDARILTQERTSVLRLDLGLAPGLTAAKLEKTPLPPLRFFLAGEDRLPADLLCFLHLRRAGPPRVRDLSTGGVRLGPLPPPKPVGFDADEALLPGWLNTLEGYRLLFELYAFPARFHFVEFSGLGELYRLGAATSFALEIPFDEPFPEPHRLRPDSFRLGCVPAVNLFPHEAEPIRRAPYVEDYQIIPSGDLDRRRAAHSDNQRAGPRLRRYEVFSVERVSGKVLGHELPRPYSAIVEVSAAGESLRDPSCLWYNVRQRPNAALDSFDPWLVLSAPPSPERVEIMRMELMCTNGRLPRELRAGDVQVARARVPSGVRTLNLTAPSASIPPPLGQRLAGRLVGYLSLGRSTLSTKEGLLRWLDLFNLRALDDERARAMHQRRCGAISHVQAVTMDRPIPTSQLPWGESGGAARPRFGQALVRGVELQLSVRLEELGVGDAYLFGAVMEHVLACQATIGTFTRLVIVDTERRFRSLEWTPRIGRQSLV